MPDREGKSPQFFTSIPSPNEWRRLSYVNDIRVRRATDRVLTRIDDLVKSLSRSALDDGARKYLLAELYYSTNYWLRNSEGNPEMHKDRRSAVGALFGCSERALAKALGVPLSLVGPKLEKHYACSLSAHGIYSDSTDVPRYFTEREKREKYKIFFQNGLALWHMWWTSESGGLVPVDSQKAYARSDSLGVQGGAQGSLMDGFGFLVMSRYRDIYVAPHRPSSNKSNQSFPKYHSTIPAGESVQFGGSIKIEGGKVKGICNDSGHYAPSDKFFINILEHFKTVGVPLKGVKLYDHEHNELPGDAEEFLRSGGNWDNVQARKNLNVANRLQSSRFIRPGMLVENNPILDKVQQHQADPPGLQQTLSKLFAQRYDVLKHIPQNSGTPPRSLWTEAWTGVLQDLIMLYASERTMLHKRKAWEQKLDAYKLTPPAPPMQLV